MDDDEFMPDEVRPGRRSRFRFTRTPHWVLLLTELSDAGYRAYSLLLAHVNTERGDGAVWPSQEALAGMLGKRAEAVSRVVNRELVPLGLVDVEVQRYGPNKTRRRNVYTVHEEPAPGWSGPASLADWYDAHPTMKGGSASRSGGAKNRWSGDAKNRGSGDAKNRAENKTKQELDEKENKTAPSARSAPDARRATAGSSAREDSSGYAATDSSGPVPGSDEGPVAGPGATETVPRPRKVTGSGKTAHSATGARTSPFTPEVRQRIYATEALLPAALRAVLAAMFPYGHLPNTNRVLIAQALESRSPEQLGERAARRWISYGYERDHYDGCLRSPLGVVEELLRPTPYCPDAECEDGVNLHTGDPCKLCAARTEQRRTDRRAGRPVPAHRPPRLYRDREQCEVCDRPFPGNAPADRVCGGCRTELARATALLTGDPSPEHEPVSEHPTHVPGQAVPPNPEFRQYREQQAQARRTALQSSTSPF